MSNLFKIAKTSSGDVSVVAQDIRRLDPVTVYAIKGPYIFSLKFSVALGFIFGALIASERVSTVSYWKVLLSVLPIFAAHTAYFAFIGASSSLVIFALLQRSKLKSPVVHIACAVTAALVFTCVFSGRDWSGREFSVTPPDPAFQLILLLRSISFDIIPGILGGCSAVGTLFYLKLVAASHTTLSLNKPSLSVSAGERKLLEDL